MKFENGKAKPLTVEEKSILAVKKATAEHWLKRGKAAWIRSFSITTSSSTPIEGDKERIVAEGEATVGFKELKRDLILKDKNYKFKVAFRDSNDEWGLPDISLEDYSFAEA